MGVSLFYLSITFSTPTSYTFAHTLIVHIYSSDNFLTPFYILNRNFCFFVCFYQSKPSMAGTMLRIERLSTENAIGKAKRILYHSFTS